jgi:deoxyguanosine kinase
VTVGAAGAPTFREFRAQAHPASAGLRRRALRVARFSGTRVPLCVRRGLVQLRYTRRVLECRYLAVEGPAGAGKGTLAERLANRLDAALVLDDTETNPFLGDEHSGRPGSTFQAQLFCLLARHRQQVALRQADLFSQATVSDYLFDKDKIYAYLNLDDNELFIYQRLYELLAPDLPTPDLVVYLQSPTDVLRRRLRERGRGDGDAPLPDDEYVRELNEAYNHFFFHYSASPLLVIETSQIDLSWGEGAIADLERQIRTMGKGTRYYVPRT